MEIIDELTEAVEFLKEKGVGRIDCSIILGTGLGALASRIEPILALNYSQIPHLPIATVEFHFGKLIYGELEGKRVLAWQGPHQPSARGAIAWSEYRIVGGSFS